MYKHACTYTHAHTHAHMYACMNTHTNERMNTHMNTDTPTHTHTPANTNSRVLFKCVGIYIHLNVQIRKYQRRVILICSNTVQYLQVKYLAVEVILI